MLLNAKQILVSELTLAENSKKEEIEEIVNSKIDISFMEYNKSDKSEPIEKAAKAVKKFISFDSVGETSEDIG